MKSIAWKFIVITIATFLFYSSTFAEGPSAWLNMNYTETKEYENSKKIQTSDSFYQNYYFRLSKSITPLLSYQLYLRAYLSNSHATDAEGNTINAYQRATEPAVDIYFRNPVYGLDIGTRRLEQWLTANLQESGRKTTEFYYSRLNITPYELPSLSLQLDRQKDYDYLSPGEIDTTITRYTGNSWYDLLFKGFRFSYNLTYTHDENKTPLDNITKTVSRNFNTLYTLGYSKSFWDGILSTSVCYQGNYVRNKAEQNATETGNVPFERTPSSGMYGLGNQLRPTVDELVSIVTLIDSAYDVPANINTGTINIGRNGNRYHNIGIQLFSFEKPVDTLYVYVNKDVTSDMNLMNILNWKVYRSNVNQPNSWIEVAVQTVTIAAFDILKNIYRYEIRLSNPQNGIFFRVINMDTVSINDVLVTEIEAFGTDLISRSGKIRDTSTFFTHGINFNMNLRPIRRLTFSLNYFLNKADQNPESEWDSISSAFKSIWSKSIDENDSKLRSNVIRTYGVSTTWLTHRLLTTTVRFHRNEAFDNREETDLKTETYSLTLYSNPLPTLDANFSFIRTYSYSFDEKQYRSNLYLLSVGSRLHRDINMITDIGLTSSKTYALEYQLSSEIVSVDTDTTTRYIRGTIDARLTQKLSGSFTYGFTTMSGDVSSEITDGALIITYRPGRFINLSANFRLLDSDGNKTTSEGILIDWLFLPAIRLNANYQHCRVEPEPKTTHLLSGYILWYITKFLDFQFTYNYSREEDEKETERHNFSGNLTCRFW